MFEFMAEPRRFFEFKKPLDVLPCSGRVNLQTRGLRNLGRSDVEMQRNAEMGCIDEGVR